VNSRIKSDLLPPPLGASETYDQVVVKEYQDYLVYKDRIYVADSLKGLSISIFDENGSFLYEIHHPVDRIKIPRGFGPEVVKAWRESRYWTKNSPTMNPIVPDYFPAFISFKISGDRIYAVTPVRKGDSHEVIVMDLKGGILERGFRRMPKLITWLSSPRIIGRFYDLDGDRFVWYDYNDAKDMYELHVQ